MTLEQVIVAGVAWLAANGHPGLSAPNYAQLDDVQMRTFGQNRGSVATNAAAHYWCSSQTMVLRTTFDPANLFHRSIVVHELVHHDQCTKQRLTFDACAREREAYDVQIKWLHAHGGSATAAKIQEWLNTNPRLCR